MRFSTVDLCSFFVIVAVAAPGRKSPAHKSRNHHHQASGITITQAVSQILHRPHAETLQGLKKMDSALAEFNKDPEAKAADAAKAILDFTKYSYDGEMEEIIL